jgi:hypothetical protein
LRIHESLLKDFMQLPVPDQQEVVHDAWFCQQVRAGLESAHAENLHLAAEVEAKFAARRALTLSQLKVTTGSSGSD